VKQQVEMKLPRGVLVRGKVTEADSGKPVPGAGVQFYPRNANNPNFREDVLTGWEAIVLSGEDGAFAIPVLPGPGHLLVTGPTPDYIHKEIGATEIYEGRRGGRRYYPDGVVKWDLPRDAVPKDVTVTLRRGVTIKGTIVGPDGKPVEQALLFHRQHVWA